MKEVKCPDDLRAELRDIEEAANLCEDEYGEWLCGLRDLSSTVWDSASYEFRAAWIAEVLREHKRLKEEFEIVEKTQTYTQTIRSLERRG